MRNIKFRGKTGTTEGKKWVYGYLYKIKSFFSEDYQYFIKNEHLQETSVDEDTIGQFTGLKDENGKEIYEGDILLAPEWFGKLKCVCIYQQENTVNPIQGFGLYSYDTYFQKYNTLVESDEWDEFEVIGNIYDNPELLEEGE